MPTYQYQCQSCQYEFEKFQSFSEDPVKVCPECGAEAVEKIITGGAGVMFKGGGFYETDYKRGKGSDYANKSEAEGKKAKPEKENKKADSKPKAESKPKGGKE